MGGWSSRLNYFGRGWQRMEVSSSSETNPQPPRPIHAALGDIHDYVGMLLEAVNKPAIPPVQSSHGHGTPLAKLGERNPSSPATTMRKRTSSASTYQQVKCCTQEYSGYLLRTNSNSLSVHGINRLGVTQAALLNVAVSLEGAENFLSFSLTFHHTLS